MPGEPHRQLVDLDRFEPDVPIFLSHQLARFEPDAVGELMMLALCPSVTFRRRCRFAYSKANSTIALVAEIEIGFIETPAISPDVEVVACT